MSITYYLPRAAHCVGSLWSHAQSVKEASTRAMLLFFVEQSIWGSSMLNRYSPTHFSQVNRQLTGVYYVASQHAECGPRYMLDGKLARLSKAFSTRYTASGNAIVNTGSATSLGIPDRCIDYIFTDPPFGENIFYADLNFLWNLGTMFGRTLRPKPLWMRRRVRVYPNTNT